MSRVKSLALREFSSAKIPKTLEGTTYLTHTQAEKALLIGEGYGSGADSRTLTIHESQGLTYVQTQIHNSTPHAVVAISRHTSSCTYYCDDIDDAIAQFIRRAEATPPEKIMDHNLQMAIHHRDETVMDVIKAGKKGHHFT